MHIHKKKVWQTLEQFTYWFIVRIKLIDIEKKIFYFESHHLYILMIIIKQHLAKRKIYLTMLRHNIDKSVI